jgi:hypothetical protein
MKRYTPFLTAALALGLAAAPAFSQGTPGQTLSNNQAYVHQENDDLNFTGSQANNGFVQQHSTQGSYLNSSQTAKNDNLLNVAQVGHSNQALLGQTSLGVGNNRYDNDAAIFQHGAGIGGQNFANVDQYGRYDNDLYVSQVGYRNYLVGIDPSGDLANANSMIDLSDSSAQVAADGGSGGGGWNNLQVIQGGLRYGSTWDTRGSNNRIGLSQNADSQSNTGVNDGLGNNDAQFQQYGDDHRAAVVQETNHGSNIIRSLQEGTGNRVSVSQDTETGDNVLNNYQTGTDNRASLQQESEAGNTATIEQDGTSNRLYGAEIGSGVNAVDFAVNTPAKQISADGVNLLNLRQEGIDNRAGLYQEAVDNNTANILQIDGGNRLAAHQTSAGSNDLGVYQSGSTSNFVTGGMWNVNAGNLGFTNTNGTPSFPWTPPVHP